MEGAIFVDFYPIPHVRQFMSMFLYDLLGEAAILQILIRNELITSFTTTPPPYTAYIYITLYERFQIKTLFNEI